MGMIADTTAIGSLHIVPVEEWTRRAMENRKVNFIGFRSKFCGKRTYKIE
jgi:hypothetical protein